jgi:hypothetical protein
VEYARRLLVNTNIIGELIIPGGNHFIPWTKYGEIKNVLMSLGEEHEPQHAGSQ